MEQELEQARKTQEKAVAELSQLSSRLAAGEDVEAEAEPDDEDDIVPDHEGAEKEEKEKGEAGAPTQKQAPQDMECDDEYRELLKRHRQELAQLQASKKIKVAKQTAEVQEKVKEVGAAASVPATCPGKSSG